VRSVTMATLGSGHLALNCELTRRSVSSTTNAGGSPATLRLGALGATAPASTPPIIDAGMLTPGELARGSSATTGGSSPGACGGSLAVGLASSLEAGASVAAGVSRTGSASPGPAQPQSAVAASARAGHLCRDWGHVSRLSMRRSLCPDRVTGAASRASISATPQRTAASFR
jgi:hypothetical protein